MSSLEDSFSEMSTAATTPIISHFSPDTDDCNEDFDLGAERFPGTNTAGASDAIDDAKTPTQSAFSGQVDMRHLQAPVRVINADPAAASSISSPSPKPVTLRARLPAIAHDVNNRFSPLAIIREDEENVAPVDSAARRPIAAFTIIARNRSPSHRVVFPALGRPPSPMKGHRQQRGGLNSGPRLGLPTRGKSKPTRGGGQSYAGMLRRGL